jgi:hypothetical protein
LPTPDKWQREVDEALFGTDEAESWRREGDAPKDLFDEDDLGATVEPVGEHVAVSRDHRPARNRRALSPSTSSMPPFRQRGGERTRRPAPEPAGAASFADPDEETIIVGAGRRRRTRPIRPAPRGR